MPRKINGEEYVSGLLLFLRFAGPCMEDLRLANKISEKDFQVLEKHLRNKTSPKISLLRKNFPNAVRNHLALSKAKEKKEWSSGTVYKTWRYHHGHESECAVRVGIVDFITNNIVFVVFGEESSVPCSNSYHRGLKVGEKVLVHRRVVVMKERKKTKKGEGI
ncbi:MAG: hypothetical protein V1896_01375 [Candidatus Zambryskibacteria bacterium]